MEGLDLGRAADRAVAGDDRCRPGREQLQHLDPGGRVALEGQWRDAEEADVAGEEDVVVDEDHEVAGGVAGGGDELDPRRIGAPSMTSWVTGRVPISASSSNSSAKAGMKAL